MFEYMKITKSLINFQPNYNETFETSILFKEQ